MRRAALALTAAILLVVAFAGAVLAEWYASSSAADEELRRTHEALGEDARILHSSVHLLGQDPALAADRTVLVVAGASSAYSPDESAAFERFLRDGGRAIVADEDGHATSLVEPFGLGFERQPILHPLGEAPLNESDGPPLWRAYLPTPVLIVQGASAQVRLWTDSEAVLDRDGDGQITQSDPPGPFPVAVEVEVGAGRLLVLGSLAPLRSSGGAASAWTDAVLSRFTDGGRGIVLDASHASGSSLLAWAARPVVRQVGDQPNGIVLGVLLVGVATVVALLAGRRLRPWGPHQTAEAPYLTRTQRKTMRDAVERHPEATHAARSYWSRRAAFATAIAILLLGAGLYLHNVQAAAAGTLVFAVLAAAGLTPRARMQARRELRDEHPIEGAASPVTLTITSQRAATIEACEMVPAHASVPTGESWKRLSLQPGRPVSLEYAVEPAVRGPHAVGPLRVRTRDPFGLRVHEEPVGEETRFDVWPQRAELRKVPGRVRRPEILLSLHPVRRAGDGAEFHAIREYAPGDPPRAVNWRASARSKSLMVNQRIHESQTEITIVVDARWIADSGRRDQTPLVWASRAALSLVAKSVRDRDRVRCFAYGDGTTDLTGRTGAQTLEAVRTYLGSALGAGETGFGALVDQIEANVRPGTPLWILTGLEEDPSLVDGCRRLAARGVILHLVAFRPSVQPELEPDAETILRRRDETLRGVRDLGVTVYEFDGSLALGEALLQGVAL